MAVECQALRRHIKDHKFKNKYNGSKFIVVYVNL